MNLSEHFTLEEATYSETAIRLHIDNQPNEQQLANMKTAAEKLEDVARRERRLDRGATVVGADERDAVSLEHPRAHFAPLMRDGFFLVPRLATHDDAGDES